MLSMHSALQGMFTWASEEAGAPSVLWWEPAWLSSARTRTCAFRHMLLQCRRAEGKLH